MSEITTIAQLSKKGRRALYYVATGVAEYEREASKACLKRLRDVGLVSASDRSIARLTGHGARLVVQAGWSFFGSAHQIRLDALLNDKAAQEPTPETSVSVMPAEMPPVVDARSPWRWCGGKAALLPEIMAAMPDTFGRLFVPFVGGGALVFAMPGRVAYISDANTHLVNAYTAIRDSVEDLILALQDHKNDRDYYDAAVESFNDGYGDAIWRAGAFMYMNKVGFNGLCRYNRRGGYNVPFGDNPKATICDADNLRACSVALRNVEIAAEDFRAVEEKAQPGDLVYLDSPYLPESKTASFTGYWGKWGDAEHEACAALFRRLVARGVHVLASNSDTPRARELYSGFEIRTLYRSNSVNSKASARGGKAEILVLGGTWTPRGAS